MIKREIRIVGIDDGHFDKDKDDKALIVGVIMRGYGQIDGVLSNYVEVDGDDTTDKIIEMIRRTSHLNQIRIIMTNGISFAGFNIIDMNKIFEDLKLPIIAVIRKKPDMDKFIKALKKVKNYERKLEILKSLPEPKPIRTKYGLTYYQNVGISDEDAEEIIIKTSINSRIPEPVRVAHLVAMGVTLGYSRGKP
ncbi:DUF99 family protein [Nanoarchaeota archaeon NZ13-N]|nr:MAG: DUF99 family protein [Nanoarchaeota archaeon NZ13-N]